MNDEILQDRAVKNYNYVVKNYNSLTGDEVELNFKGDSGYREFECILVHN